MPPQALEIGVIGAAGLVAATALLRRGELRLRVLMILAFALAAAALLLHAPPGLPALAALGALALAALGALAGLLLRRWERAAVSVPRGHRHVLLALGRVEPRLFRALMRLGEIRSADVPLRLTLEGRRPEHLWFLVSGEARIEKGADTARLEGPLFIGEVGWLTHAPASATVVVLPGAEFVEWDTRELRRACRADPRLRLAVESLVARDLARKVALGRPPAELGPDPGAARLAV